MVTPPMTTPTKAENPSAWQDIATAPRDGRKVWVRRIYKGELVAEGWAVWGAWADDAAYLQPLPADLAGIVDWSPDDGRSERRWLKPDRQFAFPEPTHWLADTLLAQRSKTNG